MTREGHFQKHVAAGKNHLLIYIDASSLIRLASLINPQDMAKRAPENPTLLRFIEHVGQLGAEVIIPESVVFETTGHRWDGTPLTRQHNGDIEYPYLRSFLDQVHAGEIKNVRIERTTLGDHHLALMEKLQNTYTTFNQYRRENLVGFGDRDIITMIDENKHPGNTFIFAVTEDRELTKLLGETKNKKDCPANVIDALTFCGDMQKAAPVPWLADEVTVSNIKDSINSYYAHNNERKRAKGMGEQELGRPYRSNYKGFSQIAPGQPVFGKALVAMMKAQGRDR